MGSGISQICAQAGWLTVIYDPYPESLERCKKSIMDFWERGVDKGKNSSDDVRSWKKNLVLTVDIADASKEADLIIEAVPENIDLKRSIFRDLDKLAPSESVLATNTSALSISEIASATNNPERVIGMHFFNPVHRMPLVEVIKGDQTSPEAINRVVAYTLSLKKTPIVVKDCPGFLVNRVLFPYFIGFANLIRDGVSYEKIDKVMETFGWPMGPAYLLDVIGIDTAVHGTTVMAEAFPNRMAIDNDSIIHRLFLLKK